MWTPEAHVCDMLKVGEMCVLLCRKWRSGQLRTHSGFEVKGGIGERLDWNVCMFIDSMR